MIPRDDDRHSEEMRAVCDSIVREKSSGASRARRLVDEHLDFVWRSLRRLGVPEADCDDGCQRVWIVLVRKLDCIEPGKERSYLFSIVVRIASEMRRRNPRRRDAELADDLEHTAANPEQALQRRQAQMLLMRVLDSMPMDLRTVFILFELEGMGTPDIAEALELPRGTVASRLRRAREHFSDTAKRVQRMHNGPRLYAVETPLPLKGAVG